MSGSFSPGDLVFARGREWVALPAPAPDILRLRPLSGGEEDTQLLLPALEPVRPARFAPPGMEQRATQDAAQLLADAQALALRRGAGPFRSAARLGFEPRAYQLVPLLMALRLPVVRLLIADDVGIGKTIEAGLILRELLDRGEIDRFAILCPPHLIEQWTGELREKFDLGATAVTAASAVRLERGLPPSQTLFDIYPHTVVSLDYIKADRRRANFAGACPSFVIVDEAHACTGAGQGRQQRFSLLRDLAADSARHMVLLSATPHSGDPEAFDRLLSLLADEFSGATLQDQKRRERLARHFVQRRRRDITTGEWDENRAFPSHEIAEATYALTPDFRAFNDAVLDYCLGVVEGAGADNNRRRLAFWGTLALMRCVGSSPEAALRALRNRGNTDAGKMEAGELAAQMMDGDDDTSEAPDNEPAALLSDAALAALITQAARLARGTDPKRDKLIAELRPLIAQGMNPVIFCRFIATAEHVAAGLRAAFPKLEIQPVTGLLPPEARRARVEAMATHERRILVATDCLSEGINLQSLFDAVIHYDLSWNPTRHQQREGRVNRFGQPSKLVRSITLYSPDSAIDGAVLDVILRKSERIRRTTGVTVSPLEDQGAVSRALLHAVLLRRKTTAKQLAFDFGMETATEAMDTAWRDAEANEARSRAIFAQNAMKPATVLPEWQRWRDLLGTPGEIAGFVRRALLRLGAPLADLPEGAMRAQLDDLPAALRERLAGRGLTGAFTMGFTEPPPRNAAMVSRNHPLPAILAEAALEAALEAGSAQFPGIGRIGVWPSPGVTKLTTILLLRLRFKLALSRTGRLLLAEDAACLAFGPIADTASDAPIAEADAARALLAIAASGDLAEPARQRIAAAALARLPTLHDGPIAAYAERRAAALAADHARLREAGATIPRVTVTPVLPADIIGLFTLIPAPLIQGGG